MASCALVSCGGGGGAASVPGGTATATFHGLVIDDYVIGAKVEFFDTVTNALVGETRTGARGEVNFDLPAQGNYLIVVNGGVIDADGDPSTTADQLPFSDTIRGMVVPALQSRMQILGGATTGLISFVGSDPVKYRDAMLALDRVVPVFAESASASDSRVQSVLSVQRSLGFSQLIAEIADDGQINGSLNITEDRARGITETVTRASGLAVKDPQLFTCIEEAVGKLNPSGEDLKTVTELVCAHRYIYSLDGIEALSGLTSLVLRGNAISSLAPLADIRTLTYVDVADNRISSLTDLGTANYTEEATFNVDDNCLSANPVVKNVEFLNASRQRATCNKVVRDPVLFNAQRLTTDKFVVSYRVPTTANCALQYSSAVSVPLQCDNRIHRLEVPAAWSGEDEYVRLNIGDKSYGVYRIAQRLQTSTAAIGTFNYTGGQSYPLRASFTINSAGFITGGEYDFHKLDGTMTPCTYSVANDATCHGASNTISITSQSGLLTSSGAASPITLNAGPDSYGFIFNGTMTGTTWSGTWTNSTQTGGGTFSVNVGISTPATNSFIGNIGSTAVSYQTNRLIAGSDQTNFQNLFRAGLFFNIPKSTEYDNVTVIGLGLPGSGLKLVNSPYSGSELILDDGSGNTYFLPNTFAPDAIPSGSTYLVRKYKGETYVGADQLYLGNRVIAPSEMTSAMFPTLALTTYAQLCPGGMPIGGTNSTFWWSMPVKQGNTASGANLTCHESAALININVRDSSGYTFSLVQTVWAAP